MTSSTLKQLQFRLLNMDTLGDRLREVMQELKIETPRALADFCGVSEGLVSQWFSGQTKLGPKPLKALAKTQFSLDWIASGEMPKYRKDAVAQHLAAVKVPPESDIVTADEAIELLTAYKNSSKKDRILIMNSAKTGEKRAIRGRQRVAKDEG